MIVLSQASLSNLSLGTSPPPPLATTVMTDPTTLETPNNLFGTLQAWEFGLIIGVVSLGIIVVLLSGVVLMGRLTVKRRRENRRRRNKEGGKDPAPMGSNGSSRVTYRRHAAQSRPKSMLEEIQMMEEAREDDVDFGSQSNPVTNSQYNESLFFTVSSTPVEILFSCILFEELLHKGTFKVVHHGIVNQPDQGLLGAPVAVKRLKGML